MARRGASPRPLARLRRATTPVLIGIATVLCGLAPVASAGAPERVRAAVATVDGTLEIGPLIAHPYDGFWSVVIPGNYKLNSSLAADFNATPFVLIRYGAEIDATNLTAGCTYSDSGVCGPLNESLPTFKVFCGWVHCLSVLGVPGEPNDAGLAAETVRYVETTIGFTPTFWSIGNEPEAWTHFGIPQPDWRLSDHSTPNGTQYGAMVANESRAILSVDGHARIIGDQDAQSGPVYSYLRNVSRDSNADVAAVAFHTYPGLSGPASPTVGEFLSPANVGRVGGDLEDDRHAYDAACGCAKSIMVGEFNGALGTGSYAPYLAEYPDVPMLAAAAAQLLEENASLFSVFAFSGAQPFDLVDTANGTFTPAYGFFEDVAAALPMGSTYAASVNTTLPGVFVAAESSNASRDGLLLVNTNVTEGLNLSIGRWFGNASGEEVLDAPSGLSTRSFPAGGTPESILLPPEGVAVLRTGPPGPPTTGNGSGPGGGSNSTGGLPANQSGGGSPPTGGSGPRSVTPAPTTGPATRPSPVPVLALGAGVGLVAIGLGLVLYRRRRVRGRRSAGSRP